MSPTESWVAKWQRIGTYVELICVAYRCIQFLLHIATGTVYHIFIIH